MSTTSKAALLLLWALPALGVEVAHRAGVTNDPALSATPQAIGTALSRVDYYLNNDADSTDDVFCGYNEALLTGTPGAGERGFKLNPGEGVHICTFADQVVYCISYGSARVYMNESRMVTPTPTP